MTDNLLQKMDPLESPSIDPNKNYLDELVGEGKKYKDPAALAYSKVHADATLKVYERQLDQLRSDYLEAKNELAARAKFEELVDRLAKPANSDKPDANALTPVKPEIDLTQIETFVSKKMQENELQKKQKENLDMVKSKLAERFGDNLEIHLKEVGLDGETAAQIAKVNPQLVLKALGVDQQPRDAGFQPPPRNSSGFTPKPDPKRTWSYYQEMFKNKPALKYDPKINTQMQKDYISLGSAFEDGDFNRFG